MRTCRWLSILVLLFCLSCDKPLPRLEDMDLEEWRKDRNACGGVRAGMDAAVDSQRQKLLGLDQMQVVKLLGNPDQNELSSRNQQFFYYFLDPAPACASGPDSIARRLVIRFNAVGLAKEVTIE